MVGYVLIKLKDWRKQSKRDFVEGGQKVEFLGNLLRFAIFLPADVLKKIPVMIAAFDAKIERENLEHADRMRNLDQEDDVPYDATPTPGELWDSFRVWFRKDDTNYEALELTRRLDAIRKKYVHNSSCVEAD